MPRKAQYGDEHPHHLASKPPGCPQPHLRQPGIDLPPPRIARRREPRVDLASPAALGSRHWIGSILGASVGADHRASVFAHPCNHVSRPGAFVTDEIGSTRSPAPAGSRVYDLFSEELLTVREVAAVMRVSKMTVYRMIRAGDIPATRVGRSFRMPRSAVVDYLTGGQVEPTVHERWPPEAVGPTTPRGAGGA